MKKKYIFIITIIILIIVMILGFFIYKKAKEQSREYQIEKINIEDYEFFILRQDDNYGVINREGNIVIDCKYSNIIIPNPQKDIFVCFDENKNTKIFNRNKEQILSQYEKVEPIKLKNIANNIMFEKNILKFEQEGKIGLINLEGEIITKPIYELIEGLPYKEGELLIKYEGKYGVINNRGNYLVEPQFDQITVDNYITEEFGYKNAGYIVSNITEEGYRYGYIDNKGNIILKTEYTEVSRIIDIKDKNNIYLIVAQNGQYGVFKGNKQILNSEYQSISYNVDNNTLIIEKTKKFGVANIDGEIIIPVEFTQIDSVGIYIYAMNESNETQAYNINGTKAEIDSNVYIIKTKNENYKIKIDNTKGLVYSIIDKNNNKLTSKDYSYIEDVNDDYFIVSVVGGKLGVINIKEEPIIDIKYDTIENIEETEIIITRIAEKNITQLYNKNLKKICEMENAIIEKKENYIKIYNQEETQYFDLSGNKQKNMEILLNNNIYAQKKDGKWGYVDKNGKVVIDYIYDKATDINKYGYAGIKLEDKWGVIDSNGKIIVKPTYIFNTQIEPDFIKEYYKVEYGYGEFYYTK